MYCSLASEALDEKAVDVDVEFGIVTGNLGVSHAIKDVNRLCS